MLIEALQSYLSNDAGIKTLLGLPAARPDSTNGIFPTQAIDQPTMPYLVLMQMTGSPLSETMEGTGALMSERWRISCHGSTYKNAKKVAKYVRRFLLSFLGNQTIGLVFVQGAWCRMEADDAESLGKGTLYSTHVDFEFVYIDLDVA
jgi:hypothetical protein